MSNLLKETLEYLPCTISAFSLNNPCSNLSCQLTAGWWISKIIPGRQGNSYRKRYRTFNVKCITSRKQKFDSVLHPCCIQVFLKWNDSHRDPGLFQTHLQHVCSWMIYWMWLQRGWGHTATSRLMPLVLSHLRSINLVSAALADLLQGEKPEREL